jgi:hypothetical protein
MLHPASGRSKGRVPTEQHLAPRASGRLILRKRCRFASRPTCCFLTATLPDGRQMGGWPSGHYSKSFADVA